MNLKQTEIINKGKVSKRNEKLDPNNSKNLSEKPMVKIRGKKSHDDDFEHRSSGEISPSIP